jgi:hypothetical protein
LSSDGYTESLVSRHRAGLNDVEHQFITQIKRTCVYRSTNAAQEPDAIVLSSAAGDPDPGDEVKLRDPVVND